MRYWEEMQSKFGFSDGDAIPPDAKSCREVYVLAVNKLAKRLGSKARVLAWDRTGMHNCYLILRVTAKQVRKIPARRLAVGQWEGGYEPRNDDWEEPEADRALAEAIRIAYDMNLDSRVETTVKIRKRK